jgi:hypothetical protein
MSKKKNKKKNSESEVAKQVPAENSEPEHVSGENMLELHNMTRKQRREVRRQSYIENTRDMSNGEKFRYFIDYYKWYIIVPVCCILLIAYLASTIYKNSRPLALSYVVLNVEDTDALDESFCEDYSEYRGLTDDYRFNSSTGMDIDYDYFKEHEEYITTGNSTDYNVLSTQCELNDYDIIISNATGIKYCSTENVIASPKGYLDSYAYNALKDYMVEFENSIGTMEYFAIDISGTDFAKELNPGYDDVYLAFPGSTDENKERALRFLEYVLNIDLIEE